MSDSVEPLYCTLHGGSDLEAVVQLFLAQMPERVAALLGRLRREQWEGLQTAAHQLWFTGEGCGFPTIAAAAVCVEEAIRRKASPSEIRGAVDELVDLCHRATHKSKPLGLVADQTDLEEDRYGQRSAQE